jgi:hypothetical protein
MAGATTRDLLDIAGAVVAPSFAIIGQSRGCLFGIRPKTLWRAQLFVTFSLSWTGLRP